MTDINKELFKRYRPQKKLEIIESLSAKELMNVTEPTIIRIMKEVGNNHYQSKRNKALSVNRNAEGVIVGTVHSKGLTSIKASCTSTSTCNTRTLTQT